MGVLPIPDGTGADGDAGLTAFGLAYICGHFAEIRTDLGDDSSDPDTPLQRLLAAVQPHTGQSAALSGADPSGLEALVDAVHLAVVRATGDAWGVYGQATRHATLAGVAPVEIVYRCPLGVCAGRLREEVTGPARCEVGGGPLRRERLS
ncbi:hypothetical protein [Streptomyces sp. cg40]|uniref:hypothetical protein n=1 Tax=Streptomyces sp. cg40 TaxID=3419764 RepID=UPI003D06AD19